MKDDNTTCSKCKNSTVFIKRKHNLCRCMECGSEWVLNEDVPFGIKKAPVSEVILILGNLILLIASIIIIELYASSKIGFEITFSATRHIYRAWHLITLWAVFRFVFRLIARRVKK